MKKAWPPLYKSRRWRAPEIDDTVSDAINLMQLNEEVLGKGRFRKFIDEMENLLDYLDETFQKNGDKQTISKALEYIERAVSVVASIKSVAFPVS